MAEIKIEKKSPIWPWILLAIALIAVVVYFVYEKDDATIYDDDINNETIDTISNNNSYEESTAPYIDSTRAVVEFENSIIDSTRIGVDSSYTKTAITNLAKVVAMKADELNIKPSMALDNLKFLSDQSIETTDTEIPKEADVFNDFQKVSKDIVTVLESIQTENYPSLEEEVLELKQTSSKIDTNIATKEQQTTIQNFFSKAKEVVKSMNT